MVTDWTFGSIRSNKGRASIQVGPDVDRNNLTPSFFFVKVGHKLQVSMLSDLVQVGIIEVNVESNQAKIQTLFISFFFTYFFTFDVKYNWKLVFTKFHSFIILSFLRNILLIFLNIYIYFHLINDITILLVKFEPNIQIYDS